MDTTEKTRENRLRRMAERRGLRLEKSRRRDPHATDYGTYRLIDAETGAPAHGSSGPMTVAQVEVHLFARSTFDRVGVGAKIDAEPGSVITVKPGVVLDIAITGRQFIAQQDGSLRELSNEELEDEIGLLR